MDSLSSYPDSPIATAPYHDTRVSSIRLISGIPIAAGLSSEGNNNPLSDSFGLPSSSSSSSSSPPRRSPSPSILAPKPDAPTRKRLVPKKSKLGLLGGQSRSGRQIGIDTSSSSSLTNDGFDIYVDPTPDPDLDDDIVVVKKQKSRGALNGVNWGPALGEVTNVPSMPTRTGPAVMNDIAKLKDEEKKWWSIGRGRKDSKEKEKIGKENFKSPDSPVRSKTPEPFKLNQNANTVRTRSHSLDITSLFAQSSNMDVSNNNVNVKSSTTSEPEPHIRPSTTTTLQRSFTPDSLKEACNATQLPSASSSSTLSGFLSHSGQPKEQQGSIALRAIRSVKSLARMGSWAPSMGVNEYGTIREKKQKKDGKEKEAKTTTTTTTEKKEKKEKKERKEKKKKDRKEKEERDGSTPDMKKKKKKKDENTDPLDWEDNERTPRLPSRSSFEVGSPEPTPKASSHQLGSKKRSILGLGLPLPASIRLPSVRNGSTTSSSSSTTRQTITSTTTTTTTTVDSFGTRAKERRIGSTMTMNSASSSLRPISMVSSSGASASTRESRGSVKWDEEGIKCVRREIQREKKEKRKKEKEEGRENKGMNDAKRRISITEIFPEVVSEQGGAGVGGHGHGDEGTDREEIHKRYSTAFPIVTIEEATVDGHGDKSEEIDDSLVYGGILKDGEKKTKEEEEDTPGKKRRPRPMSEQLLGRARPRPVYVGEDGVLSILDAATNDLAQLINKLDLEATPTSPDLTPLRRSPLPQGVFDSTQPQTEFGVKNGDDVVSPLKNKKPSTIRRALSNVASITSLRPYAQSRGQATRTLTTPVFTSLMDNDDDDTTIKKKKHKKRQQSVDFAIGQPIKPWPVLLQQISSPVKEQQQQQQQQRVSSSSGKENEIPTPSKMMMMETWKKGHKRTPTLAPEPEPEPTPLFHPLRPPKSRTIRGSDSVVDGKATLKPSVSSIFTSSVKSSVSPSPSIGRRGSALLLLGKRSSTRPDTSSSDLSFKCSGSPSQLVNSLSSSTPTEEQRRGGGRMPGTLGGSAVSGYAVPELDASDPDSDIPDELQDILRRANGDRHGNHNDGDGDDDDTFDFKRFIRDDDDEDGHHHDHSDDRDVERPRSLLPPLDFSDLPSEILKAPIFNPGSFADDQNAATMMMVVGGAAAAGEFEEGREHSDGGDFDADGDTKKSFDFTGELQKLKESASKRHSFVEQLEKAFRTPATVDLRCGLGGGLLSVEVPPVPRLPRHMEINGVLSKSSSSSSPSPISPMKEGSPVFKPCAQSVMGSPDDRVSESDAFDPQVVSQLVKIQESGTIPHVPTFKSEESPTSQIDNLFRLIGCKENETTSTRSEEDEGDSTDRTGQIIISPNISHASCDSAFANSPSQPSSDGRLNTAFKFGGLPREDSLELPRRAMEPLTLSDIIPPLPKVDAFSSRPSSSLLEDDSLFQSLFAKIADVPQPRPRASSDVSQGYLSARNSMYRLSHASSVNSFAGFDSFDEVRRGFEFNSQRPGFYPPPASSNRRDNYPNRDSVLSIASVSSYGRVINPGVPDPFDFGRASLRERPYSGDFTTTSFTIDDTFSFLNHASRRRRVDSDASSFYFRAPPSDRRRESGMSITSQAPPVSLYNRGFGAHRLNDSRTNTNPRSAWRRSAHRFNNSVDSVMSDFSAMRLGRPGIGDKMFETADQAVPLTAISASPSNSSAGSSPHAQTSQPSTYDSIIDDDDRRMSVEVSDSILDQTGQHTSVSEFSVFGRDENSCNQLGQLPSYQFRPLSFMSMASVHRPAKDDDTMITMFDGGRVRRLSMGSILQASPCARVEKRKHSALQEMQGGFSHEHESPKKARVTGEASVRFSGFGDQFTSPSKPVGLDTSSPEEKCFIGNGEDTSISFRPVPVFTRPVPVSRSRSSTCASSLGGDTPPLSACDGSSISGSSLSSLDLSEVSAMLSNSTYPAHPAQHSRARARPRGHGHRRRYSHVRSSRPQSVYETIEEELPSLDTSPIYSFMEGKTTNHTQTQPVFVVESDAASINSSTEELTSLWNDERGVMALRKYYALHDEAQSTVMESKRIWSDTPSSIFAVQSFKPPHHPEGMKALLEHSVQTYGPLPSELRPRRMRSRKDSRPSPYPQSRPLRSASPFELTESPIPSVNPTPSSLAPLKPQSVFSKNVNAADAVQAGDFNKPLSSVILNIDSEKLPETVESTKGGTIRARVGSNPRRWAMRNVVPKESMILAPASGKWSTGAATTSTDQKENMVSMGSVTTTRDSLRLSRPRPKGRPASASTGQKTQRPIRV